MSGSIDPKGIERIEAIQVEIGLGVWDAGKKDLDLIKTAFEALKSDTLGANTQLVKSLANAVATKVVDDLQWPWIKKVKSAVYRIFSGGVSLPHALLNTMTEDQVKLVAAAFGEKIDSILSSGGDLDGMTAELEKLRDQLEDIAADAINRFGENAECVEDIRSLGLQLQLTLDQRIYEKFKNEFDKIWKEYPVSITNTSEENYARSGKLSTLAFSLKTQIKSWNKDKYADIETRSPLFLCCLLQNAAILGYRATHVTPEALENRLKQEKHEELNLPEILLDNPYKTPGTTYDFSQYRGKGISNPLMTIEVKRGDLSKRMTKQQQATTVVQNLSIACNDALKIVDLPERSRKLQELQGRLQKVTQYISKVSSNGTREFSAELQADCGGLQYKIKIALLEITYERLQKSYKTTLGLDYNVKKNLDILATSIDKQIRSLDDDMLQVLRMSDATLIQEFGWERGSPLQKLEALRTQVIDEIRKLNTS